MSHLQNKETETPYQILSCQKINREHFSLYNFCILLMWQKPYLPDLDHVIQLYLLMDLLQVGKPLKTACLLNDHVQGKFDVLILFKRMVSSSEKNAVQREELRVGRILPNLVMYLIAVIAGVPKQYGLGEMRCTKCSKIRHGLPIHPSLSSEHSKVLKQDILITTLKTLPVSSLKLHGEPSLWNDREIWRWFKCKQKTHYVYKISIWLWKNVGCVLNVAICCVYTNGRGINYFKLQNHIYCGLLFYAMSSCNAWIFSETSEQPCTWKMF